MGMHFLLVGAGHAHLSILKNLSQFLVKNHEVTVINAGIYHYYSGMGPGMLAGTYSPRQIRFHVEKMVKNQGGHFIHDQVVSLDPENQFVRTASGRTISYDVVSFNTGSHVPYPGLEKNRNRENILFPVKPIRNLFFARNKIISLLKHKRPKIVVVGGGAAGVEIAANIKALSENYEQETDITLISASDLLTRFSNRFRIEVKKMLQQLRIDLMEHVTVTSVSNHTALLSNGMALPCDLVLWAAGVIPSPLFKNSGLSTDSDGGLLVNEYLQSIQFPNIFGGGDCISFKYQRLEKVGVYAVRQNPILFKNLTHFAARKPLIPFIPQKDFLVILNMGNNRGLLKWKRVILQGKAAFRIKDFIDRAFMKKFQLSDERG